MNTNDMTDEQRRRLLWILLEPSEEELEAERMAEPPVPLDAAFVDKLVQAALRARHTR